MYVRLAFAVAAHLESEILIVDEVLAVGDAEFQKKCLGKMGDVSKGEGRTVLFVSHNMSAVKNLCNKGVVLENGKVKSQGNIDFAITSCLSSNSEITNSIFFPEKSEILKTFKILTPIVDIKIGNELKFLFQLNNVSKTIELHIGIYNLENQKISHLTTDYFSGFNFSDKFITCCMPKLNLTEGDYYVNILLKDKSKMERYENCMQFHVSSGAFYINEHTKNYQNSIALMDHYWSI
jgi:lipopolysaccharide transport system ATP-binding protein